MGITFKIFLSIYVHISYMMYLITTGTSGIVFIIQVMCDWPCFLSAVVFTSYINAAFKMRDQLEENY